MLVAIHQPNFLPRPKVLDKLLAADLVIWLDDVQYVRREWQNRTLVRDHAGQLHWLTVPVLNGGHYAEATVAECPVDPSGDWRRRHLATIRHFYAKSPWLPAFEEKLAGLWSAKPAFLAPLAIDSINRLADMLGRQISSAFASDIAPPGRKTDHLIALCQAVEADAYLTGTGGLSYLNFGAFDKVGIKVFIQADADPSGALDTEWRRLSSLDAILAHGPDTFAESFLKGHYVDAGAGVADR
jgi:hypothetical protein